MSTWTNVGFTSHGVRNLTPKETFKLCSEGAIIVDVRESYLKNFKMFNVGNVIYLPYSELASSFSDLPHDKLLIFADAVGLRSRDGVLFMNEHGFNNAFNMAGGIVDWERDGLPLTNDISNRLSGSCMCLLRARENKKLNPNIFYYEVQKSICFDFFDCLSTGSHFIGYNED